MPAKFQLYLEAEGHIDSLYEAMTKDDLAEVAMEALAILKKTNLMPPLEKTAKDKFKSAKFRKDGNQLYKQGQHQKALGLYNIALMLAPNGSEELSLAYGNRSALFFACKMFPACVKDIETALALGCSKKLDEKLNKRMSEAKNFLSISNMVKDICYNKFIDNYFQLDDKINPQIPCASVDVGVNVNAGMPTVVAVNDVEVGKLLALDTAFATWHNLRFMCFACHHCHRMALNLFPCETCCDTLYCSKECQEIAKEEYHRIQCPIMEINRDTSWDIPSLALKMALKLKTKFKTWKELSEATSKMGVERMKVSEPNEIFDGNNKFSMLNMRDDPIFLYGKEFSACFGCAVVLNYLGYLKSFFPESSEDREMAMRTFARLIMYFCLYGDPMFPTSAIGIALALQTVQSDTGNFTIFPFVSKLKHACSPNVLAVGLNNKIALVAIQPLKPGTELTISYVGHWLDADPDVKERRRHLLTFKTIACDCSICDGTFKLAGRNARLTDAQKRSYRSLDIDKHLSNFLIHAVPEVFPKCCKVLGCLADQPFSQEYTRVYKLFRRCIIEMQNFHSQNFMLNFDGYLI